MNEPNQGHDERSAEAGSVGLTRALMSSALIAALGGLLFGFDTAVISGTTDVLRKVYALDSASLGLTVASALLGTIAGALLAGRPADAFGRRTSLFVIAALYLVSALGSAFAWSWHALLAMRFIGGLAVGGASVVSPMYIAEISPAAYRGRLVAVTQLNIVVGVLVAFFSNYLLSGAGLGDATWRYMLGVEAIPAAAFFLLLLATPRSPRWLVAQGQLDAARQVLQRLGLTGPAAQQRIAEIRVALVEARSQRRAPLLRGENLRPVTLAVAIAMFNQLSGINALMYYAPSIFKMAGAAESSALLQTVLMGGINLFFTALALFIIDHVGRRRLMLVGSVGYIVSLTTTAWAFHSFGNDFTDTASVVVLCSLLLFVASHAFGQGAVIWVFISEVFPNHLRARGQSLGSFSHWFMAAVVSWSFPIIAEASGGYVFGFYALMMVLQLGWVLWIMPETKGVSLEQIQQGPTAAPSATRPPRTRRRSLRAPHVAVSPPRAETAAASTRPT